MFPVWKWIRLCALFIWCVPHHFTKFHKVQKWQPQVLQSIHTVLQWFLKCFTLTNIKISNVEYHDTNTHTGGVALGVFTLLATAPNRLQLITHLTEPIIEYLLVVVTAPWKPKCSWTSWVLHTLPQPSPLFWGSNWWTHHWCCLVWLCVGVVHSSLLSQSSFWKPLQQPMVVLWQVSQIAH